MKEQYPARGRFRFPYQILNFWPKFLPVSYQCRFFGITAATFFSKPVISSLPMPRISVSLARSYHLLSIPRYDQRTSLRLWSTPQCTLLLPLDYLSELLFFLCVCVWCHSVCGSVKKDKGQGFEIRTPVPSFFTRIFHGYICLEVAPLATKLTVIGTW